MNKEDFKWLIGISIGLLIGGGTTYTALTNTDAIVCEKVANLEVWNKQTQKDLDIFRIDLSKTIQNVDSQEKHNSETFKAIHLVLEKITQVSQDLSTAVARLEVRQDSLEELVKKKYGE